MKEARRRRLQDMLDSELIDELSDRGWKITMPQPRKLDAWHSRDLPLANAFINKCEKEYGVSIPSSIYQRRLLQALIESENEFVLREELYLRIYPSGEVADVAINTLVKRMRRALVDTPYRIETRYHFGYKIHHLGASLQRGFKQEG